MTFEKYEKAEMEIIQFEAEDVITMSVGTFSWEEEESEVETIIVETIEEA